MEKLKELLIIALIWAVIIWFARVMKRKSNEQSKKFQENIPEMELIDEEERSYICENIVSFTTGRNVFLWFIILLNLWLTSVYGWKSINMAIHGTADAFSSNLCPTSVFGGIAYSTNLLRTAWLKERERNETGVLKKRIEMCIRDRFFRDLLPTFAERNRVKNNLKEEGEEESTIYQQMKKYETIFVFIADLHELSLIHI